MITIHQYTENFRNPNCIKMPLRSPLQTAGIEVRSKTPDAAVSSSAGKTGVVGRETTHCTEMAFRESEK